MRYVYAAILILLLRRYVVVFATLLRLPLRHAIRVYATPCLVSLMPPHYARIRRHE